jgi:hypothetical protein
MPPLHKSFEAQNYDDFNGFYAFTAVPVKTESLEPL